MVLSRILVSALGALGSNESRETCVPTYPVGKGSFGMPPQKRRCASCRYFQSNQLSSKNGWCTHPGRQTSSDVRILVRTDELACRNSWGSDMWVGANGESAPTSADANDTAQLPIPIQRRDDEVTSVVHRDATGRTEMRPGDVVDRDDKIVHEASLFPERISFSTPEEDDINPGAVADQEYRARVLARGGTSSAIQNARERMLARRSPQPAQTHDEPELIDESPVNGPESPERRTDAVNTAPEHETFRMRSDREEPGDAVESVTPVEAPIRTAAPRAFGRRGLAQPTQEEPRETVGQADEDLYNSVPERDPSFELPLAQSVDRSGEPAQTTSAAEAEDGMTVYEAVLQRAREIREATGREIPVFRDDEAAAERRARRRIQTIPGQLQPAFAVDHAPATANSTSTPAGSIATTPVREAVVATQMHADRDAPRTRPVEERHTNAAPNRRMGISLSDLKQKQATSSLQDPSARSEQPSPNRVNFRRSDQRDIEAEPELEPTPPHVTEREEPGLPLAASRPRANDSMLPPAIDEDDYLPLEEPQPQPVLRRRSFGRLSNPWKRDRDQVTQERQTLANVREAIDEPWEEPFIDEVSDEFGYDEVPTSAQERHQPAPPQERLESERAATPAPTRTNERAARSDVGTPRAIAEHPVAQQERSLINERPTPPAQTRSGSGSLYRPVHEALLHVDERDTPPQDPLPVPRTPTRRPVGNGATVLRVRADGMSDHGDLSSPWDSDGYSYEGEGAAYARTDPSWRSDPDPYEPGLALQEVEYTPTHPPVASPWSFSPAGDLETVEGMASFRGRLFGANSASRGERHPNDDLVVDIPTQAEFPVAHQRPPTPVRDSPLRSANYRSDAGMRHDDRAETGTRVSEQAPRMPSREEVGRYHEHRSAMPEQHHSRAFDSDSFDLRALLDESAGDVIPDVSISPDIPRMCQTCRDFRPSESGDRGFCANNWAFSHRQMVNAEALPCRSSIGCWWLPSDAIWMPEEREYHAQEELPERRRRSG